MHWKYLSQILYLTRQMHLPIFDPLFDLMRLVSRVQLPRLSQQLVLHAGGREGMSLSLNPHDLNYRTDRMLGREYLDSEQSINITPCTTTSPTSALQHAALVLSNGKPSTKNLVRAESFMAN